jgi:SAM-dependent methyltransferase
MDTRDEEYTRRLLEAQTRWWKRLLDVQAPWRWNLRRLQPGFTLEIGCGVGRNLLHLRGQGVGLDHNAFSVRAARSRGVIAFTPAEFAASEYDRPGRFDSILLSHVAEHMKRAEVVQLLRDHVRLLKEDGRLVLITPQEKGFASDPTHVEFMDFGALGEIVAAVGFSPKREFSFPFPRSFGRLFIYNEFVCVARRATQHSPSTQPQP